MYIPILESNNIAKKIKIVNISFTNTITKDKSQSFQMKPNITSNELDKLCQCDTKKKIISFEKSVLPSELSYLINNSNKIHYLADAYLLKILEN